jgi:hypothetical protein
MAMRTDDLIAQLSARAEPVKSGAVGWLLAGATALGLAGALLMLLAVIGPRPDLAAAMTHPGMWMKLTYSFAIAAFGLWLVERAGRPGAEITRPVLALALPLAAIALLAGLQMSAPGADTATLVMGRSSRVCAALVTLTALPALAAAFWALRKLAPTRLTLAGAGAGLFAGAVGAFVYCFHCNEEAAPFIAVWYTLGIAMVAGLGALLGRHLLRW